MYDIVCDAISVVNVKTNKYLVYSHSNYRPTSHVVQQTINNYYCEGEDKQVHFVSILVLKSSFSCGNAFEMASNYPARINLQQVAIV